MSKESKSQPNIEVGQIWRDHDKRRSEYGNIRTFKVEHAGEMIQCRESGTEKAFHFNRSRFGSGRANDSFELVSEVKS